MTAIVLFVSSKVDEWRNFADALAEKIPMEAVCIKSGAEAVDAARQYKPAAAIVDMSLPDMSGKALVKRLLEVDAMICSVMVSDRSDDVFHQETEGLGIAMRLSPDFSPDHAGQVAECLRRLSGAV